MNIQKIFPFVSVCRQDRFFNLVFLGIVFILISCDIIKINGLVGLSLSGSNLTIPIGEKRDITADFSPANAIASITWSNSHTNIIELTNMSDNNVTVIAKKVGIAIITAEADGITKSITVTVVPGIPNNIEVEAINVNEWNLSWSSSAGAKVYRISVSNDGFEITNHTNSRNDNTSLTINNLNFLTRYTATIQACDNSSSYCSSGSINFVPGDNGTNLAAVIAAGKIPANLSGYDDQTQAVFGDYTPNTPVTFRYVLSNKLGTGVGASWANAASNVRTVLEEIKDASVSKVYAVLIGPGIYRAGGEMGMKNHVTIVGGVSQNTSDGGETILSGNGSYRVFNNTGLTNTARLYGVTIADGGTDDKGGGMYNNNASPALTKVVFSGNTANDGGGGMYNDNSSSPPLKKVTFSSNVAGQGGGMVNNSSSPVLTKVVFSGNTANNGGGGMYNSSSFPVLTEVVFSSNTANEFGGGMYNTSSYPTLSGVVFSGNTASYYGGGMFNLSSSPVLTGVVFSGNTANQQGGGMYNIFSSSPTVVNTIFWGQGVYNWSGGSVDFYYSVVERGTFDTTNNIVTNDPGLLALANNGGGIPTMAIPSDSSAKDQGLYVKRKGSTHYYSIDNSTWYASPKLNNAGDTKITLPGDEIDLTAFDMTGYPVTGRPDIGVYEAREGMKNDY